MIDQLSKNFPDLSEKQIEQFKLLGTLYPEWNEKINVISRKDIEELYVRHILHSLAIAKVCSFVPGTKILDIGTGGGFPGIPLAILFPKTQFTLVDSIGKKIKVVQEIASGIGLDNLTAIHGRAEKTKGKFDFIVSRAVTNLKAFKPWVKGKFSPDNKNQLLNGVLYLKGGDLKDEIAQSGLNCTLVPISKFFEEEFFETKYVLYFPAF